MPPRPQEVPTQQQLPLSTPTAASESEAEQQSTKGSGSGAEGDYPTETQQQQMVLYEGAPMHPPFNMMPPASYYGGGDVGSTFTPFMGPYGGWPPGPMDPAGPFADPGVLFTPNGPMCMMPPPPMMFPPPPPMMDAKAMKKHMKRSKSMEMMPTMLGPPPPPGFGAYPAGDTMALVPTDMLMAPPLPMKAPMHHHQHHHEHSAMAMATKPSGPENACYVVCCKGHTQVLWIVVGIILAGVILGVVLGLTLVDDEQYNANV